MDSLRDMRLEILEKFYQTQGEVRHVGEGSMITRADYHHQDKVYVGTNSANIWKLQDHETTYIFSGGVLTPQEYESNVQSAMNDLGGVLMPHKKLRSATLTLIMIYDSAEQDVINDVKSHDYKVYHKYSLNGWTIHRIALILTDSDEIVTDKRAEKLERRLRNIMSI